MINEDKKIKKLIVRRKLTEKFVAAIEGKTKAQIFNDEIPGLKLIVSAIVNKAGERRNIATTEVCKSFYYSYRPKGQDKKRIFLGNARDISRAAAVNRMNEIKARIYSGSDPILIKQSLQKEHTMGDLVTEFYKNRLNKNYGYKPKTIQHIIQLLKVWFFQQTQDHACIAYFDYNIQHKKISKIDKEDIKKMHNSIGAKSPYSANRVVQYLKIIFNYAIEKNYYKKENPCKIKRKEMFVEHENHSVFTKDQAEQLIKLCFKKINQNEKSWLDEAHYKKYKINMVVCIGIAFALLCGKRLLSEVFSLKWEWINETNKTITYPDSKVGRKTYKISSDVIELLQTIKRSRFLRCYNFNDERREYVFPSPFKNSKYKFITGYRSTWKKVLKILNLTYIPLKQCRHTYGTLLLSKSKNLTVVQSALGHSNIKTTMKYAHILNEDLEAALDDFSLLNSKQVKEEDQIIEFKK
jgi:integrase